jgi:hypothetical protein
MVGVQYESLKVGVQRESLMVGVQCESLMVGVQCAFISSTRAPPPYSEPNRLATMNSVTALMTSHSSTILPSQTGFRRRSEGYGPVSSCFLCISTFLASLGVRFPIPTFLTPRSAARLY